ncbi:hypothetical protein Rhal01_00814 [Rubritalea halochordaticola]|uniref:Peptidase M14 domain-containing protein n=2 Tax=Rubritalea halochordaticola TaxID=714537 RepID=A0ABP9UW13_9BACT
MRENVKTSGISRKRALKVEGGTVSLLLMDVRKLIEQMDSELRALGADSELICEVGGYPVFAYKIERDYGKKVYLSSGIHGDEPAGPLALLELVQRGGLDEGNSWYVCPILNPTGLASGTRENAEGYDLNRDYLRFKTVEVRAHAKWLEGVQADLAISLHEDWESTGFYYYEINQLEDRPDRYAHIVKAVTQHLPMEPMNLIDDHDVREPGWIYHHCDADEPGNWPEAIYLAKRGCPLSFTFETPSSEELGKRVDCHVAAVSSLMQLYHSQR